MRRLFLIPLFALLPAPVAAAAPPASCLAAYEQLRAGQLAEAADSMAQCAQATPVDARQTVMLYERAQVLDRLGRRDEALAQRIALTDKAHFETGLADAFSGPGAWSRDPDKVRARQATGITRAELLLDIAWQALGAKDTRAAITWAERSARHALTRFRPEREWLPMDRDAGCAIALRGFARAEAGDEQRALVDIMRGHIRGCEKLPVAEKAALLSEDSRRQVEELKRQFEAYQAEARRVNAENLNRSAAKASAGKDDPTAASLSGLALGALVISVDNDKAVKPVLARRQDFLAAEAAVLGPEPLLDEAARP